SLGVMPIFMAGWASNNKYSLLGAMRSVAMTVSYEIPLVLSLVGLILLGGSFHLGTLVDYQLQHGWFVFLQPLAFLLFLIAGTAEMSRTPMDLTEGESELVAGYHTEYSGFKFVMFYMAEYTHVFAISAMITTLFLGGWGTGPVLDLIPPAVWFVGKVYLMFCVFVWIRATLPRLRIDQLMGFAWKFLIPLALANIFIVALEVQAALPSLVVFAVNAVLAVVLVMLWTQVVGRTGVAAQRTQYVTKLMSSS
ncbi:MAG TPA: complex I subunit 1 family protein, partial [Dehalococcoidia bacterium]|nr:complex I subunit 1 family protein [Dehalococcoidia bacterium]